jgi:hypothetical protein
MSRSLLRVLSINPRDGDDNAYSVEVHLNQLKQLGGEIDGAEFRLFVTCVQHTSRSITVTVHCVAP